LPLSVLRGSFFPAGGDLRSRLAVRRGGAGPGGSLPVLLLVQGVFQKHLQAIAGKRRLSQAAEQSAWQPQGLSDQNEAEEGIPLLPLPFLQGPAESAQGEGKGKHYLPGLRRKIHQKKLKFA
jgi:hypothetical protein